MDRAALRVQPVAPRQEAGPVLDAPLRSAKAERELREAERHVGMGVLSQEALDVVRLQADAPLDLDRKSVV